MVLGAEQTEREEHHSFARHVTRVENSLLTFRVSRLDAML